MRSPLALIVPPRDTLPPIGPVAWMAKLSVPAMLTPGLMMMLPALEVRSGVVVLLETVVEAVWASAGAAQINADRLTIDGPNRRARAHPWPRATARAEALEALWAACGERYP